MAVVTPKGRAPANQSLEANAKGNSVVVPTAKAPAVAAPATPAARATPASPAARTTALGGLLAQARRDAKHPGPQLPARTATSLEHEAIVDAVLIDPQRLHPPANAPREQGSEAGHEELVASIRETAARGEGLGGSGIWEPILVSHDPTQPKRLLLIAGRRRWRAALAAGVPRVPCVIRDMSADDAYEIAVVENLQREDMTDAQTAHAYQWLMQNRNYGVREMARRLGKSASEVSRKLAIFQDTELSQAVTAGDITLSQAQELLPLEKAAQTALAQSVAQRRRAGHAPALPQLRAEVKKARGTGQAGTKNGAKAGAEVSKASVALRNTPAADPHQNSLLEETTQLAALATALATQLRATAEAGQELTAPERSALERQAQVIQAATSRILELLNASPSHPPA